LKRKFAVIIPAFNEEAALPGLIEELGGYVVPSDIIVINDGSTDETATLARAKGAVVLDLACNIGVGGAVQVGFKYAFDHGYEYVVRVDGDGQHPPSEIPKMISEMEKEDADLIIGSRFIGAPSYISSTPIRSIGNRLLATFLSLICRSRITDPTSGFWMLNRQLLYYFSNEYPTEYPEPEALALLRRHGFSYREISVTFRPRTTGQSSIKKWGTFYYVFKVGLALVVDRIKPITARYEKSRLEELKWN
jgi:glycosyltransferase involved in cell wall biosynthesis